MLQNRLCTFIDILGFQNLITRTDNDANFAREVLDCLSLINNAERLLDDPELKTVVRFVLEKNANKPIEISLPEKSSNYIKGISFSDSLIISSEPTLEGWLNHILLLVLLTHKLLQLGFLVRGGMSIGNIVQEEKVVFGTGLVKAYNMESKVSIYPRITISDEAINSLENVEPEPGALTKFFASDFDGILILNYLEEAALRIVSYSDEQEIHEHMREENMRYATRIQSTRDSIQRIIDNNKTSDYKVLAKLRWIAMNMNRSLTNKEFYLVEDVVTPILPKSDKYNSGLSN